MALKGGLADAVIVVCGHTDNIGSDTYNHKLSIRRATSVVDYLVHKHGIQKERLIVKGFGKTMPIANNDTELGRSINRRVEFLRNNYWESCLTSWKALMIVTLWTIRKLYCASLTNSRLSWWSSFYLSSFNRERSYISKPEANTENFSKAPQYIILSLKEGKGGEKFLFIKFFNFGLF